ncbi:MAG TPA: hypothetical protein HA360_01195 [Nanoarchaeota archaeon]|nr:hypothetical protein [Nanoarchaeota archaeon]HIH58802.1 hypothetical protein [Nanoarchaeota archaeon]HII13667.1 hypothetical protein [Nanoarchaeota archaeon]HIJ04782.1 hypothetical protein [Nanoarchaeota archaeon]
MGNLSKWASIPKVAEEIVSDLCRSYYGQLTGKLLKEGYDIKKIGIPIKYEGSK